MIAPARGEPSGALLPIDGPALLRLLQLASPTLPVGGFAYSQGLETMVTRGAIASESAACEHLGSLMVATLPRLELPSLLRLHDAWAQGDVEAVQRHSDYLFASRESSELQRQEREMARSFRRLLEALVPQATRGRPLRTFAEGFACAAVAFGIPRAPSAFAFGYNWCEAHVSALARLVPLGPIAGQRLLDSLLPKLPALVEQAQRVGAGPIGASAPGLGLFSALHETQHCRLFRS